MKVLITGGMGFLGLALRNTLHERGYQVVVVDQYSDKNEEPNNHPSRDVEFHAIDVRSFDSLLRIMRQQRFDAIIHLASRLGISSNAKPREATEVNTLGTANVLEAAVRGEVGRVLLASSIAVYGSDRMYETHDLPLTERAFPHLSRKIRVYGASKLYMEALGVHYQEQHGITVGGLRPSIVCGPGRSPSSRGWQSDLVEKPSSTTITNGKARVNWVYLKEVAEQFAYLLELPAKLLSNYPPFLNTGGFNCSIREIAETVVKLLPTVSIDISEGTETDFLGLPASVSSEAMEQGLGYKPRFATLEDSIRDYISVLHSNTPGPFPLS